MTNHWIPFLNSTLQHLPKRKLPLNASESNVPWGLYFIYATLLSLGVFFLVKGGWSL